MAQISTMGCNEITSFYKTFDNSIIWIHVIDTVGSKKYRPLVENYFEMADFIFLIYDISDKKSFDECKKYYRERIKELCKKDIKIMLIGNKIDLVSDRAISLEEGKKLAEFHKMAFFETSALNGDNIEKAFNELISDMFRNHNSLFDKKDNIKLDKAINLENIEEKEEGKEEKEEKEEPIPKKGCC